MRPNLCSFFGAAFSPLLRIAMKILIIGTGYVGLVTGASLAEMGHHVTCLDIDKEKIERLKKGEIPIYEPGLEELVARNVRARRLFFTSSYKESVQQNDFLFLAVSTPPREDGSCNTSYLESAAIEIANYLNGYKIIVNKSTAPVGTAENLANLIRKTLREKGSSISFDIVSNPEFLKEGSAIHDCMKPDRIILGSDSSYALNQMKELYAPFMVNHDKILCMDTPSAEMTKYAANAMLAARISFMNEMAEICKRVGANINEVRKGIGSDTRIGYSFLYAGAGYGGSCFPKDIRALISLAETNAYTPELLHAIEGVNRRQKNLLGEEICKYFAKKEGVKGKTVAIWGLSFKPDTDDIREAPSLTLISRLLEEGAYLRLYDPAAMPNMKTLFGHHQKVSFCKDEFEAADGAHAIALITEWKQFRLINFQPVLDKMKGSAFFDGRNQYRPQEMKGKGFDYFGIGIPRKL